MSTYLYCFTRNSHPLPVQGLAGVGPQAPPLRLLSEGELTAVVSDASGELRPKRRDLERHQAILETLCSVGPVLPMRFGMVAEDADVRAEMRAGARRYRELLARIEGHVELNVKGLHREDALLADLLRQHPGLRKHQHALRAAGGGSHDEKVEFGERVAAAVEERRARDAEHAVARLTPHAAEVHLGPPVEGCFVNASFLVAVAARPAFEASLGRLRKELAGCADLKSYGPLPPYSFVASDEANG